MCTYLFHWPGKGEPQKGGAQKVTSLSHLKATEKWLEDFMLGSPFAVPLFPASDFSFIVCFMTCYVSRVFLDGLRFVSTDKAPTIIVNSLEKYCSTSEVSRGTNGHSGGRDMGLGRGILPAQPRIPFL